MFFLYLHYVRIWLQNSKQDTASYLVCTDKKKCLKLNFFDKYKYVTCRVWCFVKKIKTRTKENENRSNTIVMSRYTKIK